VLHIRAEILRWVYTVGSDKPTADKALNQGNPSSFFSSIFSGRSNSPFSRRARTPVPPEPTQTIARKNEQLLNSISSTIAVAVYSAHAAVKLDAKLAIELHRSTKKNAPTQVRVDLIYVSSISRSRATRKLMVIVQTGKEEYDESVAEEEKQKLTAGIFRGLHADLDGTGTTRVFIGHATSQTTGFGGHMSALFIPTVERESM